MRIIVFVKIINGELNPFDASALECALRTDGAEVTVVSMAPLAAKPVLAGLTRLGVCRVILLSDTAYAGSDTLATSYILSQAAKRLEYDILFFGRQSIDGDTAQVGPSVAAQLNLPVITNVMSIDEIGRTVRCHSRFGDEEARLPAVLTLERTAQLRFPSLRSRAGEIEIWDNSVLRADTARCGLAGSPTRVLKVWHSERGRRECRFIEPGELLSLIASLRRSEKKPREIAQSAVKFDRICAVGDAAAKYASNIADQVDKIGQTDPEHIAGQIRRLNPKAVLWAADLWGRRTAPQVAAMLKTGLCADCTELETDRSKLYMYRPAKSGSVYAKIECRTLPQMATVRCVSDSAEIIVGAGRGVASNLSGVSDFADRVGAQLCVSRGLVDMNAALYEAQIGLTGKSVSPKIYIAVGISGAVHHTCAVEGADTIIAVNPDRKARIFEYADYGVAARFVDIPFD